MTPLRIAWLTTGRGPGSFGAFDYVLNAIDDGLPVEVAVMFLNRDRGEADPTDGLIAHAEAHGIPVETLSSVAFRKARGGRLSKPGEPLPPWRAEYDAAVVERLRRHDFDLGVMFGYMLIATEPLYTAFPFINDHPAAPDGPVGTYQEVILDLIRTGATQSGCLMNVVTGDLDRGPVVTYCTFPIRDAANERLWSGPESEAIEGSPLYTDIRARGVARERPFLAETLRAMAGGLPLPPDTPMDLTADVEVALDR